MTKDAQSNDHQKEEVEVEGKGENRE